MRGCCGQNQAMCDGVGWLYQLGDCQQNYQKAYTKPLRLSSSVKVNLKLSHSAIFVRALTALSVDSLLTEEIVACAIQLM